MRGSWGRCAELNSRIGWLPIIGDGEVWVFWFLLEFRLICFVLRHFVGGKSLDLVVGFAQHSESVCGPHSSVSYGITDGFSLGTWQKLLKSVEVTACYGVFTECAICVLGV